MANSLIIIRFSLILTVSEALAFFLLSFLSNFVVCSGMFGMVGLALNVKLLLKDRLLLS